MSSESSRSGEFDPRVLGLLACPVCHSGLRLEPERLQCAGCGRKYPIMDGIPVLTPQSQASAASPSNSNPMEDLSAADPPR